jgi:mannose/fructose/N-acetylgalactosamine-specific phosphotransferase system component IIC
MLGAILTGQLGFADLTTTMPSMAVIAIVAAGFVLALAVTIRAVTVPAESPIGAIAAVRKRNDLTVFLPQRAPDAAGRPRPRAPSN